MAFKLAWVLYDKVIGEYTGIQMSISINIIHGGVL